MRAGWNAALEARTRRADPTARLMIEARVELPGADIRQTAAQFNAADSLAGLVILTDGGVQLSAAATVIAQNPNGAGAYFPGLGAGNAVGIVNWFGDEPANTEITFLTAYLNPRSNVGLPRTAVKWRCRLYQPLYKYRDNTRAFQLVPLCDPLDVAIASDVAGDVTFDFRAAAQRPRPKARNDPSLSGPLNGAATFVVITPLDASGKVAANAVWNQDPGNATVMYFNWRATAFTLHANILAGDLTLQMDGAFPANFPRSGYIKIDTETIGYTGVLATFGGPIGPPYTLTGLTRGANGTAAAGHAAGAAIFLGSHNDISAGTVAPSLTDIGWQTRQATGGGAVRMAISTGAFVAATLRFSGAGNRINLGGAPTAPVELMGRAEVPLGAAAIFQVLKTGGNPLTPGDWLTYTDGMLTTDPSFGGLVSAAAGTLNLQCILTPNAAGNVAPTLRALGAVQVTRVDLSNVAQIKSGQWEVDFIRLVASTSDFVITAIRDGERDYNDAITTLLKNNPIGTFLIRLLWGASDLPRASWLHEDDLVPEEPNPGGAAIDLLCTSSLALLKQTLPKFNTNNSTRTPLAYPSAGVPVSSLDKVWLDLVQNQLGDSLGGRWIGPGLPAVPVPVPGPSGGTIVGNTAANPTVVTTQAPHGRTGTFVVTISGAGDPAINGTWPVATVIDATHFSLPVLGAGGVGGTWAYPGGAAIPIIVAKTIVDTTANPVPGRATTSDTVKLELDALAYIGGFANIPSQGRIKAVDYFGPQSVKAVFAPEAIRPVSISTGLRQRQAEAFVNWGWDGSKYRGIAYAVNLGALTKLGNAFIDPQPLDDAVCQWLQQQTGDAANQSAIANALALRIVNTLGTGLLEWEFVSDYAYPELEGGDLVAVPTDWFVGNDPNTGTAIAGPLYALAIVKAWEPGGRAFTVVTRSLSDLQAAGQPGTRVGFGTPAVVSVTPTLDPSQNVSVAIHATGAAAVRFAVSTAGYPTAVTVGAAALNALDANGNFSGAAGLALLYGQTGYLSAIAYENADGSGAASVLFQAQITAPAAALTSLASAVAFPRANHLNVSWAGLSGVASVKIAFSKVAFPAPGTGTAFNGQTGQQDMGALVYADFAYVTVTPYSGAGATGIQGPAVQVQSQLPNVDGMFDNASGQPLRTQAFTDGKFAVLAATNDGKQVDRTAQIAGQKRSLVQMLTELVPNAEFDVWESASQPHAWANDLTAGAVVAQETVAANVFSGDYALKYSNPDNASNSGWHGVSTNDLVQGAFCVPLRAGLTYRVKIASKTSRIAGGQRYRIVVSFNAAETLQQISPIFTYAAVGVYQVNTFLVTVPAAAEPNSKVYVQFSRNGDATATDFWADSLRWVEDTVSAADLAAAAAGAGKNIIQNPGFEAGVAYWQQTSGGSLDSTSTTPYQGLKSGALITVASTTHRIRQCDRASDLSGGQNPAGGSPLYIPVVGGDELFGSFLAGAASGFGSYQFGVEEYDASFTFIQRTYIAPAFGESGVGAPHTIVGGLVLQATTAYVVPIFEAVASVGGGGATVKFDGFTLIRVSPPKLRVKAFLSAAVAATTAVELLVSWNNNPDAFDVGAMHDPTGVAQAASKIIAPTAAVGYGALQLHAQIQFAANATGYRRVKIRKNGATLIAEAETVAVNGDVTTLSCSVIDHRPAAGDYYEVLVLQNSGGNLNVNNAVGASFFEATQIV